MLVLISCLLSTSNSVFIEVNPINDGPVANNDYATTDEDADVEIKVILNDTDADGNSLTPSLVSGPSNGNVTLNGTIFEYSPEANFNGNDSFVYIISDGANGTDTATGEWSYLIHWFLPLNAFVLRLFFTNY